MSSFIWCRFVLSLILLVALNAGFYSKSFAQQLSLDTEQLIQDKKIKLDAGMSYYNFFHNQDFSSSYAAVNSKLSFDNFKFDGLAWFSMEESRLETFSVKELYYKKSIYDFNVYIGRRIHSWTELEEYKPTGFWNNAWDFNKTDPALEGLFGVFVEKEISTFSKINFFVSPISIPKFVTHNEIRNQQSDVVGRTPWATPPPNTINYNQNDLQVNYNLEDIDYLSLVSDFQVGASFDYENEKVFFKTSYLFGGAKDLDLGLDFVLDSSDENTPVQILVEPEAYRVHRIALDLGFKWSRISKTGFSFNHRERTEGLLEDARKSFIGIGSGSLFQLYHKHSFGSRYMVTAFLNENTEIQNEANGELGELLQDFLSVPFRFVRGGGINLDTIITRGLNLTAFAYYDVQLRGLLGRIQTRASLSNAIALNMGIDVVEPISDSSSGFYREFRRNDFAYGSLSYVF